MVDFKLCWRETLSPMESVFQKLLDVFNPLSKLSKENFGPTRRCRGTVKKYYRKGTMLIIMLGGSLSNTKEDTVELIGGGITLH